MGIQSKLAVILTAPLAAMLFVTTTSRAQTPSPIAATVDTPKPARARIVEDVPGPNERVTNSLIRVAAIDTPSGFRVPRYVSLKYSTSNGRTGPSRSHPVAWQYSQRGLPMIVIAETETWRKVRDVNGDETWMKRRLLDGTRTVLVRSELSLRSKPRSDSKKTATAGKGALLRLEACELGWCRVNDKDQNLSGYALQTLLWGAEPL